MSNEWVGVNDRLPEDGRSVYYKTEDGQTIDGKYFDSGVGFVSNKEIQHGEATHWKYAQ